MIPESILADAQADLYERTLADEFLAQVAVLNMQKGVIESEVDQSLGVLSARAGGKIGACIIVEQPIAAPGPEEVIGAVLRTEFSFLVLEDPTINGTDEGTRLSALTICRRLVALHHFYQAAGLLGVMTLKQPGIIPVSVGKAPVEHRVLFEAEESSFGWYQKVSNPTISPNGGSPPQTVTLSCLTPSAEIYFTTDGSYPRAGNASAELYTAPFLVGATARVRACAFKSGMIASDVVAANFE